MEHSLSLTWHRTCYKSCQSVCARVSCHVSIWFSLYHHLLYSFEKILALEAANCLMFLFVTCWFVWIKGILAFEAFLYVSAYHCLSILPVQLQFHSSQWGAISIGALARMASSSHATPLGMHDIKLQIAHPDRHKQPLRKFWQPHPVHRNWTKEITRTKALRWNFDIHSEDTFMTFIL